MTLLLKVLFFLGSNHGRSFGSVEEEELLKKIKFFDLSTKVVFICRISSINIPLYFGSIYGFSKKVGRNIPTTTVVPIKIQPGSHKVELTDRK